MDPEIVSFGCRLNAAEADAMRALATGAGLSNVAVVNTCAVTGEAVRQARKAVRRLAGTDPARPIVVTGCAAQIDPAAFAALAGVTRVIGNGEKTDPRVWTALAGSREAAAVPDVAEAGPLRRLPADTAPALPRAFLPVQNGCDHRCTFCTIPFGRGRSRSLPVADVIADARGLLERGARELVLTGVDLTAYGADLPGTPRLGTLVQGLLCALPDLPRLRISSIDSVEADPALLDALAGESRLMPHLHLSLQAGDDLILKRMKRRHGRADAIAFCDRVRRLRPDIVLGADLIAGFPTETEAMFARSLDLVAECGLTHLHVFPFSARPDTPASRMPPVDPAAIRSRTARLREAGAAALASHLSAQIGRTLPVLVEAPATGRTEGYAAVSFTGAAEPGRIVDMTVGAQDGRRLHAEVSRRTS